MGDDAAPPRWPRHRYLWCRICAAYHRSDIISAKDVNGDCAAADWSIDELKNMDVIIGPGHITGEYYQQYEHALARAKEERGS